ncbi:MAG: hypothetical protein Q4A30_02195 [Candidatus Saccharibacteria bacterium]|nr:hypothetical protein [Candidatus Saccharibacteria bacterium]
MKQAEHQRNSSSSATHHILQKSSTLNRRYVRRPDSFTTKLQEDAAKNSSQIILSATAKSTSSAQITSVARRQAEALRRRQALAAEINLRRLEDLRQHHKTQLATKNKTPIKSPDLPAQSHPFKSALNRKPELAKAQLTALELKNQAIKQALAVVNNEKTTTTPSLLTKVATQEDDFATSVKKIGRGKKLLVAFACSTACVAILGYFLYVNLPDFSVRVAALQTGIEASYPTYLPRNFQLASVSTTKNSGIIIEFKDSAQNSFTLSEEKSSWDSSALLSNHVKINWDENYTTIREQGITIYLSGSNAAWVNGGILYRLTTAQPNLLSKQQIKDLATSL